MDDRLSFLQRLIRALQRKPPRIKNLDLVDDQGIHLVHAQPGEASYWITQRRCNVVPHTDPQLLDFRLIVLPWGERLAVYEKHLPAVERGWSNG